LQVTDKAVPPGSLDASPSLGIVELGRVPGTNHAATSQERLTAAFNVADALNPRATAIPVTRVEGITRAVVVPGGFQSILRGQGILIHLDGLRADEDRKSTRLNSSHVKTSYAVFCLK